MSSSALRPKAPQDYYDIPESGLPSARRAKWEAVGITALALAAIGLTAFGLIHYAKDLSPGAGVGLSFATAAALVLSIKAGSKINAARDKNIEADYEGAIEDSLALYDGRRTLQQLYNELYTDFRRSVSLGDAVRRGEFSVSYKEKPCAYFEEYNQVLKELHTLKGIEEDERGLDAKLTSKKIELLQKKEAMESDWVKGDCRLRIRRQIGEE